MVFITTTLSHYLLVNFPTPFAHFVLHCLFSKLQTVRVFSNFRNFKPSQRPAQHPIFLSFKELKNGSQKQKKSLQWLRSWKQQGRGFWREYWETALSFLSVIPFSLLGWWLIITICSGFKSRTRYERKNVTDRNIHLSLVYYWPFHPNDLNSILRSMQRITLQRY